MRMFDAMIFKREIGASCKLDVEILQTLKDGLVLRIMESSVDEDSLALITDFVNRNELNLLLDNGVYFISKKILLPSLPAYLSE